MLARLTSQDLRWSPLPGGRVVSHPCISFRAPPGNPSLRQQGFRSRTPWLEWSAHQPRREVRFPRVVPVMEDFDMFGDAADAGAEAASLAGRSRSAGAAGAGGSSTPRGKRPQVDANDAASTSSKASGQTTASAKKRGRGADSAAPLMCIVCNDEPRYVRTRFCKSHKACYDGMQYQASHPAPGQH